MVLSSPTNASLEGSGVAIVTIVDDVATGGKLSAILNRVRNQDKWDNVKQSGGNTCRRGHVPARGRQPRPPVGGTASPSLKVTFALVPRRRSGAAGRPSPSRSRSSRSAPCTLVSGGVHGLRDGPRPRHHGHHVRGCRHLAARHSPRSVPPSSTSTPTTRGERHRLELRQRLPGLGPLWMIGAIYWESGGVNAEWLKKYGHPGFEGFDSTKGYINRASSSWPTRRSSPSSSSPSARAWCARQPPRPRLAESVALDALATPRRACALPSRAALLSCTSADSHGGELGGQRPAKLTAVAFVGLWFVYIIPSILKNPSVGALRWQPYHGVLGVRGTITTYWTRGRHLDVECTLFNAPWRWGAEAGGDAFHIARRACGFHSRHDRLCISSLSITSCAGAYTWAWSHLCTDSTILHCMLNLTRGVRILRAAAVGVSVCARPATLLAGVSVRVSVISHVMCRCVQQWLVGNPAAPKGLRHGYCVATPGFLRA